MNDPVRHLYEFGPFRLDASEHLLLRDGQPVPLTPKAFDTLRLLVRNRGHILTKEELMQAVWPDALVEEGNLNKIIYFLRKALEEDANGHKYIETVPKRGYRFVAEVREVSDGGWRMADGGWKEREGASTEENQPAPSSNVSPLPAAAPPALQSSGASKANHWAGVGFKPIYAWMAAVLLIGLAVTAAYLWTQRTPPPVDAGMPVRSVAVLPFKLLDGTEDSEYLGLGMADALITQLSALRQITVRPTDSIRKYTESGHDPLAAGHELSVESLLYGNIQRSNDRMRVTAQLVRVRDGAPLWAGKFDSTSTNIFAMQDSISEHVTRALTLTLTGEEKRRLTKRYTEDVAAYQLYSKGRYYLDKGTPQWLKKALEGFQQAIDKDPTYALAYAGLADAYMFHATVAFLPSKEWFPKARAAAMRALEIDDQLAEAHATLGHIKLWYDWDWPGAEAEYRRAFAINPNYATAHRYYALFLSSLGRHDEAIVEIKRAQALNPLSSHVDRNAGWIFYIARQYDQAIKQYQKTVYMDAVGQSNLAWLYVEKGMYGEAVAEFLQARELQGQRTADFREIYAVSGIRGFWQKWIEELKDQSQHGYVGPHKIAHLYARLGEKDQAFAWLEKAYEDRSFSMVWIKVVPWWYNLRTDPRFVEMVRRVGLPP